MDFIAHVQNIKNIRGETFIALNCSMDNVGAMCKIKDLPLDVIHNGGCSVLIRGGKLVGYTCLEYDVVRENYNGELAVGDTVVFGNVGGYTNVSKPPFILWNVPIVAIHPDGTTQVIKRQENIEDILGTYWVPAQNEV